MRGVRDRRDYPWVDERRGTYDADRRPVVDGAVVHRGAVAPWRRTALGRRLTANGLPRVGAGIFPPRSGDDAGPFVPPLSITAHPSEGRIPRPRTGRARCVGRGAIGVSRLGAPIMTPVSPAGDDLVAREVGDRCGGRITSRGRYYFRPDVACMRHPRRHHSRLIGFARDGHGLYGPRGDRGRRMTNNDLDVCHGHSHRTTLDGIRRRRYHFHQTRAYPYLIGCYRAAPSRWRLAPRPAAETLGVLPERPEPARLEIEAVPGLYPGFDRDVHDYVTRCHDKPVRVVVRARGPVRVALDGRPAAGGDHAAEIPLSGGQAFSFTLTTGPGSGTETYHVRCLPTDFPEWSYRRSGIPSREFYAVTPTVSLAGQLGPPYAVLFNRDGVPIWWLRSQEAVPVDFKVLDDKSMVFAQWRGGGFATTTPFDYRFADVGGEHLRTLATVGTPTDHHDLQPVGNGNYYLVSYRLREGTVDLSPYGREAEGTTVFDAEVQEITPEGQLVFSWNSREHIDLSETGRWWPALARFDTADGRRAYDPAHINAVEPGPDGSFYISLRHTDAVYKIDRESGNVEWKLGGTTTPQSLGVLDDPLGAYPLGGQHDVRRLGDGTITVHDNGTGLARPARAVRYAIDEGARTARLLEDVRDPATPPSPCCGSARRLEDGSWIMGWGAGIVSEMRAGRQVFSLSFGDFFSYRAAPVPRGLLTSAELRAGMSRQYPRP